MSAAHRDELISGEKIAKLISQIETLTKTLEFNVTRAPPQQEEKNQKIPSNKRFNLSGQFHKNQTISGIYKSI